jgi:uncharacterized protein YjbJ (UPF0337 family)
MLSEIQSLTEEITMGSSEKNKLKGLFHQAKGKVKEISGKVTDNPKLRSKGKAENLAGKAQEKVGQVEKVLGD